MKVAIRIWRRSCGIPRRDTPTLELGRANSGAAMTSATRGAPMINRPSAAGLMMKPDPADEVDGAETRAGVAAVVVISDLIHAVISRTVTASVAEGRFAA